MVSFSSFAILRRLCLFRFFTRYDTLSRCLRFFMDYADILRRCSPYGYYAATIFASYYCHYDADAMALTPRLLIDMPCHELRFSLIVVIFRAAIIYVLATLAFTMLFRCRERYLFFDAAAVSCYAAVYATALIDVFTTPCFFVADTLLL